MSHRFKFKPLASVQGLAREKAHAVLRELRAEPFDGSGRFGIGVGFEEWAMVIKPSPKAVGHEFAKEEVGLTAALLNETFDRLRYAMENPDAAMSFAEDGTPRLFATDDSGIDHEALFKIGRS